MKVPETSVTLLSDIASNSRSARWAEFVERYRPMMMGYLKAKFPLVEAEDIIQDALISLAKALPNYRYNPDETGYFHNYIAAVLRNKACDAMANRDKHLLLKGSLKEQSQFSGTRFGIDDKLRKDIYKIALRQLLEDDRVNKRNLRIFVEVAIKGVAPTEVAEKFGVTRNNVDQIKKRIITQLRNQIKGIIKLANG